MHGSDPAAKSQPNIVVEACVSPSMPRMSSEKSSVTRMEKFRVHGFAAGHVRLGVRRDRRMTSSPACVIADGCSDTPDLPDHSNEGAALKEHGGQGQRVNWDDPATFLQELWKLANSALTRIEPILATFTEGPERAGRTSTSPDELPTASACVWCPVCALAAAVHGDHHKLLVFAGVHVAEAPAVVREFLDEMLGGGGDDRETQPDGCSDVAVSALGRSALPTHRQSVFVPIDVNLRR